MKILVITSDFPPNVSGIATLSYEQSVGLAKLGSDVLVVTSMAGAASVAGAVPVVQLTCGGNRLEAMLRRNTGLKRAVQEFRPDFLWCTNYRGFALPTLWAARKFGIPYGIYYHGTEVQTELRSMVRRRIFSVVANGAALRACNSRNTAELLRRTHNVEARVVTPGVRAPANDMDTTEARKLRDSWTRHCCGKDPVVLLMAGRLSRQKGIDMVIRAMQVAPEELRDRLIFVVAGAGPDRVEFERLASNTGLEKQVVFLGALSSDELGPVYGAADFYVQPSQPVGDFLESFGISFLEAQAHGLPCLGTNWGGIPESVKAGKTGILVETGSVAAITDAIQQLVLQEYWRTAARDAAVKWARENSWNSHVELLNGLIREAVQGGGVQA